VCGGMLAVGVIDNIQSRSFRRCRMVVVVVDKNGMVLQKNGKRLGEKKKVDEG
jgi:hypothetical protein